MPCSIEVSDRHQVSGQQRPKVGLVTSSDMSQPRADTVQFAPGGGSYNRDSQNDWCRITAEVVGSRCVHDLEVVWREGDSRRSR